MAKVPSRPIPKRGAIPTPKDEIERATPYVPEADQGEAKPTKDKAIEPDGCNPQPNGSCDSSKCESED
jgi:hypothetical protein